jgi:isopenicillin N synthase-like dioxygenase
MLPYQQPTSTGTIPIISMAPAADGPRGRFAVAREIHRAARDTGFFYLVDHGVAASMLDAQLLWTRRFFALPPDEKMRIKLDQSPAMRGYEPIAGQVLDSGSPPDLKESFYVGEELAVDHPLVRACIPNHGPNQWPQHLPGFREQMYAYFAVMQALERRTLRLLALSLDLAEDYFEPMYHEPMSILRLLHYPPHPASARPNQLGAGAHTDWGLLTFLLQDDIGGLEVRDADGRWMRATPIAGSFVVNLGDMIVRWTNGLYHSTMHRVLNNVSGRDRYSVPFFGTPRHDARVETLANCISADNPARFAPCTAGEHLAEMYRKTYGEAAAG